MLTILTFMLGSIFGVVSWILMSDLPKKKSKSDNLKLEHVLDYDEYCEVDTLVRKRQYEINHTTFEDLSIGDMDELEILEKIRKKL